MFTRRQFLLDTGRAIPGLILPSYYYRALEFLERNDAPMLDSPPGADRNLYFTPDLHLYLDEPEIWPPVMTWREYLEVYGFGAIDEELEDYGISRAQLNERADPDFVADSWFVNDSPTAKAFDLLNEIDLGPELEGAHAIGGVDLIYCPRPGSDWIGAQARDRLSLSLLQQRLNELGMGIAISRS